ncbi:MAG: hypothetical protein ACRED7_03240, partial [Stellaceae bacterium]
MANWLKRLLGIEPPELAPGSVAGEPEFPPTDPKNSETAFAEPWEMEVVKSFRSRVAGVSHNN